MFNFHVVFAMFPLAKILDEQQNNWCYGGPGASHQNYFKN